MHVRILLLSLFICVGTVYGSPGACSDTYYTLNADTSLTCAQLEVVENLGGNASSLTCQAYEDDNTGFTISCDFYKDVTITGVTTTVCSQVHCARCSSPATSLCSDGFGKDAEYSVDPGAMSDQSLSCDQYQIARIGTLLQVVCPSYGNSKVSCGGEENYQVVNALGKTAAICSTLHCASCVTTSHRWSCFPEEMRVQIFSGAFVSMIDLRIGHLILADWTATGEAVYSKVVDIPHRTSTLAIPHHRRRRRPTPI